MAPSAKDHHQSKSLLLFQKLLNQRDGSSPLTLVFDTLAQPGTALLKEFATRAKISKTKVVFVSFSTFRKPEFVDVFVPAWGKKLPMLKATITKEYLPLDQASLSKKTQPRTFVIIDSLNPLLTSSPSQITPFLSSLITPTSSLVAIHHSDVPTLLPPSYSEYTPPPIAILSHLATAILHVSPLSQALAEAAASHKALPPPPFGLVAQPVGALKEFSGGPPGLVVRMDLRRKSGRQVSETFCLRPQEVSDTTRRSGAAAEMRGSILCLLNDVPGIKPPEVKKEEEKELTTFNLGLTEKQRKERGEIVLPYFDAQTDIGGGEGGRILYEMGSEDFDDFDEEEDEEI